MNINLHMTRSTYETRTTLSVEIVFSIVSFVDSSTFLYKPNYTNVHENALFININIDNGLAPV